MYLIYVNELGPDYKGERIYEFIFSDKTTEVSGEDWDLTPASTRPNPPDMQYIKKVESVCDKSLVLDLVQNSDHFSMMDAMDEIIALGWESFDADYDGDVEGKRLVFRFGETYESVTAKLSDRKLKLKSVK